MADTSSSKPMIRTGGGRAAALLAGMTSLFMTQHRYTNMLQPGPRGKRSRKDHRSYPRHHEGDPLSCPMNASLRTKRMLSKIAAKRRHAWPKHITKPLKPFNY
jgi:hypothetical protein